jgi:hypothetical protein
MKRKIFAALAISAIAFVSCKKDEAPAPVDPGNGTISGTLWANTNVDNDTDDMGGYEFKPEYAPAGVTVTAVINGAQLDQTVDPDYTYPEMKYTAVTGTNGSYSLTVPAYANSIEVELRFNDFTANQLSGGDNNTTTFTMGGSQWVDVWDGAVVIKDYTYND